MWPLVSSVAIPAGGHAGEPRAMLATAAEAAARQLPVGASLGYRDPASAGERFIDYSDDDLTAELLYQLGGLDALVVTEDCRISFVRVAGALGEASRTDRNHAWAVVNAVLDFDPSILVVGPAGSRLLTTAERHGLDTAVEYQPSTFAGGSGSRGAGNDPGAIAERTVAAVARGGVDSVWLPSGTADERAVLEAVRQALTGAGHRITPIACERFEEEAARFGRLAG